MGFVRNLNNKSHLININNIVELVILESEKSAEECVVVAILENQLQAYRDIEFDSPVQVYDGMQMSIYKGTGEQCQKYIDKFFVVNIDIDEV